MKMTLFKNRIILQILNKYKDLWALSYVSAVNHWDMETYMPKQGIGIRAEALGRISAIRQRLFLDKDFISLLHKAYGLKHLSDQEKGIVRILIRSLDFYQKIPSDFLEEFEKLTNTATLVWREAKEKNNFKIFQKDLTKIFDMNLKMAEYLKYKNSPYDALLDQYEEGLNSNSVSQFFSDIKDPLKILLNKITSSKKYQKNHFLEKMKYDKDKMADLNQKVLKYLWKETGENFRLDISTHPFTTSFGKTDTRITTWYHDTDFARSFLATIHEFGHALYDLQSADSLEMTPIAGGSSLVIHESQSRFWENHVGRSKEFIKKFLPDMLNTVHGSPFTVNDVYLYFNKVSPSLLRVESDEVTYHFHIMIRFEIERDIIEGKLKVKDLPEIWNLKMKEYLGIVPKGDSDGCLQDIHWSGGSVGYFPTYSLGTFLGSQWEEKIKGEKREWLKNNIHQYGSTYTLENLLKKNKMKFDHQVNLDYLTNKYSKIYSF